MSEPLSSIADPQRRRASVRADLGCWGIALALLFLNAGCAALHPIRGVPASYLPLEFIGPSRDGLRPINPLLLTRSRPAEHLVDAGDVLTVYIPGILGTASPDAHIVGETPPINYPQDPEMPPTVGFPITVRGDGTLSLPQVPPIPVRGLTLAQVEEAVRRAYTTPKQILAVGRERILVSLQRPREYRVLVVREDMTPNTVASGAGTVNLGNSRRGTARIVSLKAYENDVLHALSRAQGVDGLPGLDAEGAIYVIRRRSRGGPGAGTLPGGEFCPPNFGQPHVSPNGYGLPPGSGPAPGYAPQPGEPVVRFQSPDASYRSKAGDSYSGHSFTQPGNMRRTAHTMGDASGWGAAPTQPMSGYRPSAPQGGAPYSAVGDYRAVNPPALPAPQGYGPTTSPYAGGVLPAQYGYDTPQNYGAAPGPYAYREPAAPYGSPYAVQTPQPAPAMASPAGSPWPTMQPTAQQPVYPAQPGGFQFAPGGAAMTAPATPVSPQPDPQFASAPIAMPNGASPPMAYQQGPFPLGGYGAGGNSGFGPPGGGYAPLGNVAPFAGGFDELLAGDNWGAMASGTIDGPGVVRIPVRIAPGEMPHVSEQDVTLEDGDVVFIEARSSEVFYTGGLLGGGQFTLPRDYDLRALEAISIAGGQGSRGGNSRSSGGVSALNQDVTISASKLIVVRRLEDGTRVPIEVDLNRAKRDMTGRENIIIQPGDYLYLQYSCIEAIGAFFERHLLEGALFGLATAQFQTGGGN